MRRVLVVGDQRGRRMAFVDELGDETTLLFAESGRDAIAMLAAIPEIAAVVVDVEPTGGRDGFDVLRAARSHNPDCVRILVSGRSCVSFDHETAGLVDTFFGRPWVLGTMRQYLRARLAGR